MTLLSTKKLAERLGVHVRTLQNWARDGKITPTLLTLGGHPRYDPNEIEELMASGRMKDGGRTDRLEQQPRCVDLSKRRTPATPVSDLPDFLQPTGYQDSRQR